jgi:hypothetical protein
MLWFFLAAGAAQAWFKLVMITVLLFPIEALTSKSSKHFPLILLHLLACYNL